ncbi:TIGR03751 family conjugal transfer lipoprotein [Psychromonas sp. B3M02]|uniref:TIGR03751 family conjugal transfer lipoprotein n=1 Tax=Psychromonas sp. B3M02 TaxID=2267226 RepID=UPI000DEBC21F|nr:TIGR03751 family conjugal transfer lipoprotein [Psychromonas sp. B3M02]RBW47270.1 TIGR03751 family conjugal transfer lipoprotein [Psychromonas sp. B3M02]
MTHLKKYSLFLISPLLFGCATKIEDFVKPDSLTMKEIYNGSFNETEKNEPEKINNQESDIDIQTSKKKRELKENDLRGYTRNVNNETKVLFKKLENPMLVGYVFPHLNSDNIPIPGYSVPFRMSDKDLWAIPGER